MPFGQHDLRNTQANCTAQSGDTSVQAYLVPIDFNDIMELNQEL